MSEKTKIKTLKEHIELHRCPRTGVAWVSDGSSGLGHSCHPNIDATGSVDGMRLQGYWGDKHRVRKTGGFIYNIDMLCTSDELDRIAAEHCECEACLVRRERESTAAAETIIRELVDHLTETHQDEIDRSHYGDEHGTCSYCRTMDEARAWLDDRTDRLGRQRELADRKEQDQ